MMNHHLESHTTGMEDVNWKTYSASLLDALGDSQASYSDTDLNLDFINIPGLVLILRRKNHMQARRNKL